MKKAKELAAGMLLCFAIALASWFLGKAIPLVGGAVFGIVFGMLLHTFLPTFTGRFGFGPGIQYTSKKLLQYSIILLGFQMNMFDVLKAGGQSFLIMLCTLSAAFIIAYTVGKAVKLPDNITTLIGVGTSICGGSAIAAAAPVIGARDEEIAKSISTIFLFNIIAVFLFPPLGRLLSLSDTGFGMWAGTAVNDTSSVVAAASAWSNLAGSDTALSFATVVKLTRALMIVPITLALAVYTSKKKATGPTFSFAKVFPWFVLGFIAAALINTFAGLPPELTKALAEAGKFMIVMAMAAIGLNTNLKRLILGDWKPIVLGLCCWVGVACVSLIAQFLTNFV